MSTQPIQKGKKKKELKPDKNTESGHHPEKIGVNSVKSSKLYSITSDLLCSYVILGFSVVSPLPPS